MRHLSHLFILCLMIGLAPARAEVPPVPKSKSQTLGSIEKQLKSKEQEKKQLEKQMHELEDELETTREKMVRVGKSIQNNEKDLQRLEIRISELETEQEKLERSLEKDRSQIANLVLALERIRRVPPEALLARPDAPLKTAQSAMLMGDIIPTLNKRAESLKENLQQLDEVSTALGKDREEALKTSRTLLNKHKELSKLIGKRETLYSQTQHDFELQQKEVQQISKQAKNLRDLVQKLDEDRKRKAARQATKQAVLSMPDIEVPDAGAARLPIAGIIRTQFEQEDDVGAPSMGIKIEGRPGALVTAPMGGVIRFTGPFKRYGNLIIIEHKDGYHSLIAGLEKIDTVVGRSVNAGEPVGLLQNANDSSKAMLYYELRKNGKPIDPARKITKSS